MDVTLYGPNGMVLGPARGSKVTGGLITAPGSAAFDEAVERGNVYVTANQTTVTTQAGLSATTPALTLANRPKSGKGVRIWYVSACGLVAAAAGAEVFAALGGYSPTAVTETTSATVRNMKTGDASMPPGVAALAVATLPAAPVAIGQLGAQLTGAITTVPTVAPFERWYNGSLRLAEGFNFSIQTSTATTLFCEYIFEVVDL